MTKTEINTILIREKCIEANPSIKDLVFGCEVKWTSPESIENKQKPKQYDAVVIRNWGNGAISIFEDFHVNVTQASHTIFKEDTDEIIGRPIRLADVLLAIATNRQEKGGAKILIGSGGLFCEMNGGAVRDCLYVWNLLADDLTQQSPETIAFIAELLHE